MKRTWPVSGLYALAAGMQLCWLGATFDLANQNLTGGSLPILDAVVFYPLAFVYSRLLPARRRLVGGLLCWMAWGLALLFLMKVHFYQSLVWGNFLWLAEFGRAMGRMFHAFNPEGLMVLSTAVLWGLGWRLARTRTHFSLFIGEFQFGLAILLIGFFLDANWGRKSLLLIPAALAFFPLALLGISVSNGSEQTSWLASPHKSFWLWFLFLSIGLILALGLLISVAVSPSFVDFLLSLLAKAGLWILDMIGKLLHLLAGLFPPPKDVPLPPPLGAAPGKGPPREHPFELFSESTREVLRFIWGAGFFTLILIAVWRICRDIFEWLLRKLSGMEGAEVETIPGAFREDLLELLKRIWLAFRIKWPWGRKKSLPPLAETELVRRVYRQLLRWAAARGCARHLSQTPMEYLQNLLQWLPEGRSDFTFITRQYVRARYSLEVPTEKELEHLETSWVRLKGVRIKKRLTAESAEHAEKN